MNAAVVGGGTKGVHGDKNVSGGKRMTDVVRGGVPMENTFDNNTDMAKTSKIKPISKMLHDKFGLDLG